MKILDILAIIFLVLKLTGLISWSWWIILAPIWIPVIIVVVYSVGCRLMDWILDNDKY